MHTKFAILLTAVLCLGAPQAATAADLPIKAPVYNAPVIAPLYNWNGFYVGGHAGWGWVDVDVSSFNRDAGTLRSRDERDANGFLGGAQLGFNWMVNRNILLGIEADVSAAAVKTNFDITSPEGTASKELKADWFGTVRGRIGYVSNNWLLYGTGGFAWAHLSHYNIQITCGPANPTCLGAGLFNPETLTSNLTGWTAGGGLEAGLSPNWTAKLEYLHMDFGSFQQTGVIFNRRYDINSLTTDVVRLGLNYRFGGR